jgi:hypothetical protein
MYFYGAILLLGLMTLSVEAREQYQGQYANISPAIQTWFTTQHNKSGQWCCNESDGHDFYGDYWLDADGSVEFDADGMHHHLPDYMVLDGSNPLGHAVWWYADCGYSHIDYCFALGGDG